MPNTLTNYWLAERRLLLVAVAALAVALALPHFDLFAPRAAELLGLHLLAELVSVIISMLVVTVSWQTFDRERRAEANLLAAGFVAVGLLDLAHALAYDGMPPLFTDSSTQKAVTFWLAARTVAVLTMGVLALRPRLLPRRRTLVRASLCLTPAAILLVTLVPERLPAFFIQGSGVTPLKSTIEYLLVAGNLAAAWRFVIHADAGAPQRNFALATSCLLMAMGELMFAHYLAPSSFLNMAGHVFKLAAYVVLYRAIYLTAIRAPYERLARTEQELRTSENFARRIIETAPDPIILVDVLGRILLANRRAEEIFGYTQQELLGHPVEMLMPLRYRDGHCRLRGEYMAAPQPRLMTPDSPQRQVQGQRKDGKEFAIEVAFAPVDQGDRPHIIAVMRDISARKAAEAALNRLNAELEERVAQRTAELQHSNRELEAFSYTVAHDLRAPLRAIVGFSTLLREDHGLQGEAAGLLDHISAAAQRMAQQIDALLGLARLSRAQMHMQAVDLSALALHVAAELRQADPQRLVEVEITPGLQCNGDPVLLRSVLQNLIGNAWKYTGKTVNPRIRFGRDPGGEYFVADNGVGFDMRYASRLFQVFQRMHTPEQFAGIGIGLASVRRIIERHGGSVRAEAQPGIGATFYFTLDTAARS